MLSNIWCFVYWGRHYWQNLLQTQIIFIILWRVTHYRRVYEVIRKNNEKNQKEKKHCHSRKDQSCLLSTITLRKTTLTLKVGSGGKQIF